MEKKKGGWGEQERGKKQLKTKKKKAKACPASPSFLFERSGFCR